MSTLKVQSYVNPTSQKNHTNNLKNKTVEKTPLNKLTLYFSLPNTQETQFIPKNNPLNVPPYCDEDPSPYPRCFPGYTTPNDPNYDVNKDSRMRFEIVWNSGVDNQDALHKLFSNFTSINFKPMIGTGLVNLLEQYPGSDLKYVAYSFQIHSCDYNNTIVYSIITQVTLPCTACDENDPVVQSFNNTVLTPYYEALNQYVNSTTEACQVVPSPPFWNLKTVVTHIILPLFAGVALFFCCYKLVCTSLKQRKEQRGEVPEIDYRPINIVEVDETKHEDSAGKTKNSRSESSKSLSSLLETDDKTDD